MLEEIWVDCPYCGEGFVSSIDLSEQSRQYWEDCQVCCRPILFHVTVEDGALLDFEVHREDD